MSANQTLIDKLAKVLTSNEITFDEDYDKSEESLVKKLITRLSTPATELPFARWSKTFYKTPIKKEKLPAPAHVKKHNFNLTFTRFENAERDKQKRLQKLRRDEFKSKVILLYRLHIFIKLVFLFRVFLYILN